VGRWNAGVVCCHHVVLVWQPGDEQSKGGH